MPRRSSGKSKSNRSQTKPKVRQGVSGRIRTTHVGSLIRPPELQEFLKAQREQLSMEEAAFKMRLDMIIVASPSAARKRKSGSTSSMTANTARPPAGRATCSSA